MYRIKPNDVLSGALWIKKHFFLFVKTKVSANLLSCNPFVFGFATGSIPPAIKPNDVLSGALWIKKHFFLFVKTKVSANLLSCNPFVFGFATGSIPPAPM